MTVCIAALFSWVYGEDDIGRAVVTASDRMMTATDIQYEPPNMKVSFLAKSIILLVSGDMAVHSEAIVKIQAQNILTDNSKVGEIAEIYAAYIREIRLRRAVTLFLSPLGLDENTFIANQKHMVPQMVFDLSNELRTYTIDAEALVVGCDGPKSGLHLPD